LTGEQDTTASAARVETAIFEQLRQAGMNGLVEGDSSALRCTLVVTSIGDQAAQQVGQRFT
jgi:hypothetical protein